MTDQINEQTLRPIERTVRRLRRDGFSHTEVAWRLRRSPGHIQRIEALSTLRRSPAARPPSASGELRPIERCVLNALEGGTGYAEIAARLRRTPQYVSRIEQLARTRQQAAS